MTQPQDKDPTSIQIELRSLAHLHGYEMAMDIAQRWKLSLEEMLEVSHTSDARAATRLLQHVREAISEMKAPSLEGGGA